MENQNNPNPNSENQDSAEQQNNPQPNQENENQLPNQEPKDTNIPSPHPVVDPAEDPVADPVADLEHSREEPTPPHPNEPTPPRHSGPDPESRQERPTEKPDQQPEDMLAGTDETPTPAPEPTPRPPVADPVADPVTDLERSREERSREESTSLRHSGLDPESRQKQPTETQKEPESLTPPPPEGDIPKPQEVSPKPKSKKTWVWWIVVGLILAGGVTTYFLDLWPDWLSSSIDSIIEVSEPEESFIPLFPRSSTMPNGSITIQGNTPRVTIYNLEPSVDKQFNYQLVLSGASSQFKIGSFDGSDEEGELINLDGSDVKLNSIDDITSYDIVTIKVISRSASSQTSTIAEGSLVGVGTNSTVSADLNFPYPFDRINAGVEMSVVQGGESIINFDATSLPNLSTVGYEYELRLVEFEGPNVASELTLGRFQGNTANPTSFTSKTSKNLSRFNQVVVSLEPVWDTNPTISQIKPFSGEI